MAIRRKLIMSMDRSEQENKSRVLLVPLPNKVVENEMMALLELSFE
jgi:hypothetical protein